MAKPKFGDVYRDHRDGEMIMVIAKSPRGVAHYWLAVILSGLHGWRVGRLVSVSLAGPDWKRVLDDG